MYGKLCFVILMCLAASAPSSKKTKSCYANNFNPYLYTGTKTSYDYVLNGTGESINLPNCKPLQIWLLCRHGTRYPDARTITKMLNLTHFRDLVMSNHQNEQRGLLCDKDLQNLKNWELAPELDSKRSKQLTEQGERDLLSLGERLQAKFPELFVTNASVKYKFRSTDKQRTINSMKFFMKGAFGDKLTADPEITPVANDTLLKIYKTCDSWLDEKKKPNKEIEAFINGPEMTEVIAEVSQRLGFTSNISRDEAFLLYNTCRFEKAWYQDKISPWCAAFTDDAMRIFEYEDDLYSYYYAGYGMKTNNKLGCHLVRDMLNRFTKLEQKKGEKEGVFYFTHSVMMTLFFTTMNIGKDTVPITASNFQSMSDRNWRTSLLVPFATNVAAVFYSCDSDDSPFKVAFYLTEKPLTLEGCENGVCDWMQLKEKLTPIVAGCNANLCRRKS